MSIKRECPCDCEPFVCPYDAEYGCDCEYWCGAEEPEEDYGLELELAECYELDLEMGFDPYLGCYTDDC